MAYRLLHAREGIKEGRRKGKKGSGKAMQANAHTQQRSRHSVASRIVRPGAPNRHTQPSLLETSHRHLGPRSALEKLSQTLIRSGEVASPRQTSIDKTNDCLMKSERGALVRDSDPSSGHRVHKTTGDGWRASARRLIRTHLGAAV